MLICDVGPRDGLQNIRRRSSTEDARQLRDRLGRAGAAARRGGRASCIRGACRRWRAPRRSRRRCRRGTAFRLGAGAERARLRARAGGRVRRGHVAVPVTEDVQRAQPGHDARSGALEAVARSWPRANDGRPPRRRSSRRRLRLPVRGRGRSRRVLELASRAADCGADELMLADTIGVAVPAQVPVVAAARGAAACPSGCISTTRATPATPTRSPAWRRGRRAGRICRRHRRLPVRARARPATSPPRTWSTCWSGEGVETGVDLDAVVRVPDWLAARLGDRLPGLVHVACEIPPK